jgi:predicted nuclease with TOPRIM domain
VLEEALVVRDAEIELLNATVTDLVSHYEQHAGARERAAAQVELLEGERAQLSEAHQRLSGEHAQLSDERAMLLEDHGRLLDDHGKLLDERTRLRARADQLFVQLEDSRTGTLAALDLLRDALLERLHEG